ncbi:hypothetical protein DCAR_0832431 [Daucus carota subsp. sativus]|uniref:Uncharacterized protein n=1 Tax=Daucus carota subsp. sativus TaxID=79200 RepID=A0A175YPA7_DAUCS|nr:hypothetical protein DCAR_0832431 [Daucus carota subsp. sativus]
MSFQGFGKSSGPGAPPTSSNPFASSFPRNTAPAQPLFAPPPFQPSASLIDRVLSDVAICECALRLSSV